MAHCYIGTLLSLSYFYNNHKIKIKFLYNKNQTKVQRWCIFFKTLPILKNKYSNVKRYPHRPSESSDDKLVKKNVIKTSISAKLRHRCECGRRRMWRGVEEERASREPEERNEEYRGMSLKSSLVTGVATRQRHWATLLVLINRLTYQTWIYLNLGRLMNAIHSF